MGCLETPKIEGCCGETFAELDGYLDGVERKDSENKKTEVLVGFVRVM